MSLNIFLVKKLRQTLILASEKTVIVAAARLRMVANEKAEAEMILQIKRAEEIDVH